MIFLLAFLLVVSNICWLIAFLKHVDMVKDHINVPFLYDEAVDEAVFGPKED